MTRCRTSSVVDTERCPARSARAPGASTGRSDPGHEGRALLAMADALVARTAEVLDANAADVAAAREAGTAGGA